MKCPKCDNEMEEGFIPDSGWFGGPASTNLGWKPGKEASFSNIFGKKIKIEAYRCKNCGYLESYAKQKKGNK